MLGGHRVSTSEGVLQARLKLLRQDERVAFVMGSGLRRLRRRGSAGTPGRSRSVWRDARARHHRGRPHRARLEPEGAGGAGVLAGDPGPAPSPRPELAERMDVVLAATQRAIRQVPRATPPRTSGGIGLVHQPRASRVPGRGLVRGHARAGESRRSLVRGERAGRDGGRRRGGALRGDGPRRGSAPTSPGPGGATAR